MAIRILIADDNSLVRRALAQVLYARGNWEIIEAENGEEAVQKAKAQTPDLIILDLAMPVMDGMRAARSILLHQPKVPIILHTLHWKPRIALEALRAGVRKVVAKTDSAAILSAVDELVQPKLIGYVAMIEEPKSVSVDPVVLPAASDVVVPTASDLVIPGASDVVIPAASDVADANAASRKSHDSLGTDANGPATRSTAE